MALCVCQTAYLWLVIQSRRQNFFSKLLSVLPTLRIFLTVGFYVKSMLKALNFDFSEGAQIVSGNIHTLMWKFRSWKRTEKFLDSNTVQFWLFYDNFGDFRGEENLQQLFEICRTEDGKISVGKFFEVGTYDKNCRRVQFWLIFLKK